MPTSSTRKCGDGRHDHGGVINELKNKAIIEQQKVVAKKDQLIANMAKAHDIL